MAQLKLMKKEWFDWFKGTTLDNITAWTEYYYINPDSQHWISNYQLWDEEWEVGSISTSTGENITDTNCIRSKNYIEVGPNTPLYWFNGSAHKTGVLFFYDKNKAYLGTTTIYNNAVINVPNNAVYLRFRLVYDYGTTYNHDICINASNATFNGHYEPRIIKIEDILGVVDLGSLTWTYRAQTSIGPMFYTYFIGPKVNPSYTSVKSDYFVVGYENNINTPSLINKDKIITSDYNPSLPDYAYVIIKDSRYTDAVSFKQAMSGTYLIFIKADSPLG